MSPKVNQNVLGCKSSTVHILQSLMLINCGMEIHIPYHRSSKSPPPPLEIRQGLPPRKTHARVIITENATRVAVMTIDISCFLIIVDIA